MKLMPSYIVIYLKLTTGDRPAYTLPNGNTYEAIKTIMLDKHNLHGYQKENAVQKFGIDAVHYAIETGYVKEYTIPKTMRSFIMLTAKGCKEIYKYLNSD